MRHCRFSTASIVSIPPTGSVLPSDDVPDERPRRRSPSVARTLQMAAWIVLAAGVVVAAFVSAGTHSARLALAANAAAAGGAAPACAGSR